MSKNFPLYSQLPNACGLATFLMFVNPDKNIKVKDFLDQFYPKVKDFYAIDQEKKEFQWAYVLDYLLLKSIGNNKFSRYLSEKIPEMFENYKLLMHFELEKNKNRNFDPDDKIINHMYNSFFESDLLHPFILRNHLISLKWEYELKLLFFLFGGEFIPQISIDGTGSFFFSRQDTRDLDSEKFLKKFNLLKEYTTEGQDSCVAINTRQHWLVLESVYKEGNNYFMKILDPARKTPSKIKITKRKFSEKVRFYLFKYDLNNAFILSEEVKQFLGEEIERDKKNLYNFFTELEVFFKKSIEQKEKEVIQTRISPETEQKLAKDLFEGDLESYFYENESEEEQLLKESDREYIDTEEKLLEAQEIAELISSERFDVDGLDFGEDILSGEDEIKHLLKKAIGKTSKEEFVDKIKFFFKKREYSD